MAPTTLHQIRDTYALRRRLEASFLLAQAARLPQNNETLLDAFLSAPSPRARFAHHSQFHASFPHLVELLAHPRRPSSGGKCRRAILDPPAAPQRGSPGNKVETIQNPRIETGKRAALPGSGYRLGAWPPGICIGPHHPRPQTRVNPPPPRSNEASRANQRRTPPATSAKAGSFATTTLQRRAVSAKHMPDQEQRLWGQAAYLTDCRAALLLPMAAAVILRPPLAPLPPFCGGGMRWRRP